MSRVAIVQELKWESLNDYEAENAFVNQRCLRTEPENRGPIVTDRATWLGISGEAAAGQEKVDAEHDLTSDGRRKAVVSDLGDLFSRTEISPTNEQPSKRPAAVESEPPPGHQAPNSIDSPLKAKRLGGQHRTGIDQGFDSQGRKAEDLARDLLSDAQGRLSRDLLTLELPEDPRQRQALRNLEQQLRHGIQGLTFDPECPATSSSQDVHSMPRAMNRLSNYARAKKPQEKDLEDAWCDVVNHAAEYLQQRLSGVAAADVKYNGQSSKSAKLFWVTSTRNTSNALATVKDVTKPDAQGADEAVTGRELIAWGRTADPKVRSAIITFEAKPDATYDCGTEVLGQLLRNHLKHLEHNPALFRSFTVSLCGPKLRLWMADATSYASSPAYDVRDPKDALPLAQILAMAVSQTEQLVPSWKPVKGQTLTLSVPVTAPGAAPRRRRVKILDEPQQLPFHQKSLWGRRTLCWAATAVEVDASGAEGKPFPLLLKCAWLPEYLDTHEYQMLHHLDADKTPEQIRSFPTALGYLDWAASELRDPPATVRLPQDPRNGKSVLDNSDQARLYVLAENCVRGQSVFEELADLTLQDQMRIFRDLLRLIRRVSKLGIHYRDINLGNYGLKPNWRQLPDEESCLILYDFGNSRYLNEPRGGDRNPKTKNLPLGADDAQSCNSMFASYRMLGRDAVATDIKSCKASLAQAQSDDERDYFQNELQDAERRLAALDHRYIDDCESATWATLFLLREWYRVCGGRRSVPPPLAHLHKNMHVQPEKELFWTVLDRWRSLFRNLDYRYARMLHRIREIIDTCQKAMVNEALPATISSLEDTAYDQCDQCFKGFS